MFKGCGFFALPFNRLEPERELACRQLCGKIVATLPREVRDMIYAQVLDNEGYDKDIHMSRASNKGYLGPLTSSDPKFPPQVCKMGMRGTEWYLFERRCVGSTFLLELTETFYRTWKFIFTDDHVYLLPTFLGYPVLPEPSGGDLCPMGLVQKLDLKLGETTDGWQTVLKGLHTLIELKCAATINIELRVVFRLGDSPDTPGRLSKLVDEFDALFPAIRAMKESGHKVRVYFASNFIYGGMRLDTPDSL
ncbi:uncharacterized protein N0V89_008129 [Didymosphaeria variabile]|uniref:Uncharacterized protein n=1 Tax=Didymosphaeria variabile TaxID=1932322 RepID=A0A9W8XFU2_9PLEO|nr:uncharacterized protein N0V89_008129 [Didymosphaeria variabile]KAJ4349513.1 hypothetical protein N0V89_008129 [Didymosphaeria variabile]